jgi:TolB-like protein/Tfp pilus assembly protein PilF
MSPAKDQEYMSDGMAEELLNRLAKAPDLKVIARTSSFAFKGKDVNIAEIAGKLNVAHVLEGSVRTSGDTIRVTAQLVRTADSTQLWSATYDRPLDDIFAIQDEIADAIAQALQIKLKGGSVNRREGGTQNLEAYQLYLRAWNGEDWNTESSLDAAGNLLEHAIKLDPGFGIAWSALATVNRVKVENGYLDAFKGTEQARRLTQHALQLSPSSAHAHASLSAIHLSYDWNWADAATEIQQALALDPTNSSVLLHAARLSMTLGRWEDAERQLHAALGRDPLSSYAIFNLGQTYYRSGRLTEAEATLRRLLEVSPDFPWTRGLLGAVLLEQGNAEAALAVVQQEPDREMQLVGLPIVLQAAGRQAEADAALQAQIAQWADTGALYVALTYAYRGDHDQALAWLDRAYRQKDPALIEIVGEPLFEGLYDDPRYKTFLRKMNLPESPPPATDLKKHDPPS